MVHGVNHGAGGWPDDQTFFAMKALGHLVGRRIIDFDQVIDDIPIEDSRFPSFPEALETGKAVPLLRFDGNDEGASLALFDGREPSQKPTMIALRTQWSKEEKRGFSAITLTKGGRKDEMRAGLFMQETDTMEGSHLQLGGDEGKTAPVRVNQKNGKLEVWDQDGKGKWTTP